MWNSNKILSALMLAASAWAVPALAQTTQAAEPIRALRISVVDPASGREVASLGRAEPLQIRVGQQLRLELVDPNAPRRSNNVPASWELVRPHAGLQLLRADRSRGTVIVHARALPSGDEGRRAEIGYRIPQSVRTSGENLQWGQLQVEILEDAVQGGSMWQAAADRTIAGLYHGILLRAPDSGATGYRDTIARDGWSGARRVAREIAESRESEVGIYEKGSCNQARLLEMYEHLLGIDPDRVDQRRWREQLQRLERGDVSGVVDELVQTREFAARFGLS